MIRRANFEDIGWITDKAIQIAGEQFPELRPDEKSIRKIVTECIGTRLHLCLVSGDNVLIAQTGNVQWAERKSTTVMLWTGDARLIREFTQWFDERKGYKAAVFELPEDPRLAKFMEKLGYQHIIGNWIKFH